jgi:hypothetical protein
MAISRYDAYEGKAEMPNGRCVEVKYLDAQAVLDIFGYQPPGHPNRKRVGWYWTHDSVDNANAADLHGPHTSSRKAMVAALQQNHARAA